MGVKLEGLYMKGPITTMHLHYLVMIVAPNTFMVDVRISQFVMLTQSLTDITGFQEMKDRVKRRGWRSIYRRS